MEELFISLFDIHFAADRVQKLYRIFYPEGEGGYLQCSNVANLAACKSVTAPYLIDVILHDSDLKHFYINFNNFSILILSHTGTRNGIYKSSKK